MICGFPKDAPREVTEEEFVDWCKEDLLSLESAEAEEFLLIMSKAASRSPLVRAQMLHSVKSRAASSVRGSSISMRSVASEGLRDLEAGTSNLETGDTGGENVLVEEEEQRERWGCA